jgi:hypothetical protein
VDPAVPLLDGAVRPPLHPDPVQLARCDPRPPFSSPLTLREKRERPACRGGGGRGVSRVRKAGRLVSRLALCR